MNIKEKTAMVSTGLNVALTLLKFVTFFFTGSIAILADAWHSFIDIITSLLVYFSVAKTRPPSPPAGPPPPGPQSLFQKITKTLARISLEQKISFCIGIFLLIAAVGLLRKVIVPSEIIIANPLMAGIVFIFFSFGSYIVFKYETAIGKKETSSALVADGMHSKADMITAFLTGISLLLYKIGINIDRPVALVIAFFVFLCALETVVSVVLSIVYPQNRTVFYKSTEIIASLFDGQKWKSLFEKIDRKYKTGFCSAGFYRYVPVGIVLCAVCVYAGTMVYTIGPAEEGILERFGRPVNRGAPVQPGIHFKYPYPVDTIIKVNTRTIRQIQVGNKEDKNSFALLWTVEHGTEEPFISADNNFFYPYVVVHYTINNVFSFYYNYKNQEMLIDNVAHRVITNIFSQNKFYYIVTTMRNRLSLEIQQQLQDELDRLQSGLRVVTVNIKDIHPPIFIADVFEDVVAASQDKQKYINEAYGYRNNSLPDARGQAWRQLGKAESYVDNKIKTAAGDAQRFLMRRSQLDSARIILQKKLYLETIKNAIRSNQKIIVDPAAGTPDIWLNFPDNFDIQGGAQ